MCGTTLGARHGNRKYHPNCAAELRRQRARAHSAAYRRRRRGLAPPEEAVEDYVHANMTVRGAVIPGQRVLELRAAVWSVMFQTMQCHLHLQAQHGKHIAKDPTRMRLRGLVDEARYLLDLLNEYLPPVLVDTPWRDPVVLDQAERFGIDPREYVPPSRTKIRGAVRIRTTNGVPDKPTPTTG